MAGRGLWRSFSEGLLYISSKKWEKVNEKFRVFLRGREMMELLTSCGLFVSGYEFCTTGAEDVAGCLEFFVL